MKGVLHQERNNDSHVNSGHYIIGPQGRQGRGGKKDWFCHRFFRNGGQMIRFDSFGET